jgi:hypothetical protein
MTVAVALPPLRRLPRSISPAVPLAVPPRVGRPRTRGWPVRWAAASLSLSLARVLAQRRWSWTTPGVRGRFGRAGIELRIRVILLAEERRDIHWSWSSCERHAEAGQPTGQWCACVHSHHSVDGSSTMQAEATTRFYHHHAE